MLILSIIGSPLIRILPLHELDLHVPGILSDLLDNFFRGTHIQINTADLCCNFVEYVAPQIRSLGLNLDLRPGLQYLPNATTDLTAGY